MKDPKLMVIARRGQAAIAALLLFLEDNNGVLRAFSFKDEMVGTAAQAALDTLGLPGDTHIKVTVLLLDLATSDMSDAQAIAKFADVVQAKDTAYFYRLVDSIGNSKGGQA